MLKYLILLSILLLILSGCAGGVSDPTPLPAVEQPVETPAVQTPIASESPKPTTEPGPITTKELTENLLLTHLGAPDKVLTEPEEAGSRTLVYKRYNRYFSGNSDSTGQTVYDSTYAYETFGKVKCSMSEEEVVTVLGEPSFRSEFWSDIDDTYSKKRQLDFYSEGVTCAFGYRDNKSVLICIMFDDQSFNWKTSCGIGIGSTYEDVMKIYGAGLFPDDEFEENGFVRLGNEEIGCLFFKFEDGNVCFMAAGDPNYGLAYGIPYDSD